MNLKEIFSEFDDLINKPVPNFSKIELALSKISPAALSLRIQEDVGFTYLLDYYLRFVDASLVKNILQNPLFQHEALEELFFCHITSFHKAILQKKPVPSIMDTYWSYLSKTEYAILFQKLINRPSSFHITRLLFDKINIGTIKLMISMGTLKSDKMLGFFKELGSSLKELAAKDIQYYDLAHHLASINNDDDYILFLEEYTSVFVQLRIASFLVEDVESKMKEKGTLSFNDFAELCMNVPIDTLPICLDIFVDKKWITSFEKISLREVLEEKYKSQKEQNNNTEK